MEYPRRLLCLSLIANGLGLQKRPLAILETHWQSLKAFGKFGKDMCTSFALSNTVFVSKSLDHKITDMENHRKGILTGLLVLMSVSLSLAQNIGINSTGATPDSSAMLDITSADKGILIPRMDSTSRGNIPNPAKGLMVFDSTYNSFWYYDGLVWAEMISLDEQQLSFTNDSLFLTNDPTPVDLTAYRQGLSLSNDTLYISNSAPVDLSPYNDTLGNHIATQNIQLNGHMINNDGDAGEGIYVDTAGRVGFNHAGPLDALLQIGTAPGTVYKLKDNGFQINEYTLPITAGNADDVLMTDGNGNVSWVNPTTQGFGDTLGNHIATQNINSGGHWIDNVGAPATGILLDTFGQMGVNTTPQANLHVFMERDANTSAFAAFTSSTYTSEIVYDAWQSFTSTKSGKLSDLLLTLVNWPNPYSITVSLVAGEGLAGPTLYSTSVLIDFPESEAEVAVPLPANQDILLEAGQKYSIRLSNSTRWQLVDGNPYAGGQSSYDANRDFAFRVLGNESRLGFMVSDTSVTFNEYRLPATDGMMGESLVTDGAGNLTWANLQGAGNQQLTLVNDTLSLTDGGLPIDLSPYRDPDNMGNHMASQNLLLGAHRIQYDASRGLLPGIAIDTSNSLSILSNSANPAAFKCIYSDAINPDGVGAYLEVNNQEGTRALFGPDGFGYSGGNPQDVALANWGNGDLQFLTNGTQQMYISADGNVGIGRNPVTNVLEIEGDASKSAAGDWLANSDRRLKKNIEALDSKEMLEKLTALEGISYEWADEQTGTQRPEGLQYGFTAQNIQENFPSLVTEDNTGYLQTAYGSFDAMTVAAIAALQEKVVQLQKRNANLKTHLEEVEVWKAELQSAEANTPENKKANHH